MPEQPRRSRRGFLSKDEKSFIERNRGKMSAELMAAQLNRAVKQVMAYLDEVGGDDAGVPSTLKNELERRPEWERLRRQFAGEELEYFKYRYTQLMNQFGKDDVLPTEEMQIFQLITMEILADESMGERKVVTMKMRSLQKEIEKAYGLAEGPSRRAGEDRLRQIESDYANVSTQLKNINLRHQTYISQQKALLQDLKATRDQRKKVIEDSGKSFLGFLKALTDEDFRSRTGVEAEMVRLASVRETARMSTPHTYVDGTVDQPFLTPETVKDHYGASAPEDPSDPADAEG